MPTTTIEPVRSFNRPSDVMAARRDAYGNRIKSESAQPDWPPGHLEAKRAELLSKGLGEIIASFSASPDEALEALATAIEASPKQVTRTCRDCGAEYTRSPGGVTSRRCSACSDTHRNELSAETARRKKANRPPAPPRVRVNDKFVPRVTTGDPCPGCGQQPPNGNRYCNQTCYRAAHRGQTRRRLTEKSA